MSWSAPMTAVANDIFTAAQFNQYVRDNLLETAPAKATTAGGIFVATGANAIQERIVTSGYVATTQGTTSGTYTDLSTVGPTVTTTTGTSAIVLLRALAVNSGAAAGAMMSVAISGSSSIAAADSLAVGHFGTSASIGCAFNHIALTPGTNTFTAKYKTTTATSTTATFQYREMVVIPL